MSDALQSSHDDQPFRSKGFGLHYDNMRMLGEGDIIVASIGGAGQALLGNLLLELKLNYINLATETLLPDGSSVPLTDPHSATRRSRLAATNKRDTMIKTGESYRPGHRFMKTHLPVEEFAASHFDGVWVLVRDPRDALYSWHQFHRRFAERDWEKVPYSFEEFLRYPFFTQFPPVEGWTSFYTGWSERANRCRHSAVIRFEDLKLNPYETMRELLRTIDLTISDLELRRAIEGSSYETMRSHEDAMAKKDSARPDARIMRSGKIEEWRSWMTPRLASYFKDDRLDSVARQFGYTLAIDHPYHQ